MNKCICDICGVNEANNHFKVKQLDEYRVGFSEITKKWVPIDICNTCYNKLVDEVVYKKLDICKYYVELKGSDTRVPTKGVCYGTKGGEECFCHGKVKYCTHYPEKRRGVN